MNSHVSRNSQSRSRLVIGGLALAAIILVISLLLSQQSARLPVMVQSPLTSEVTATAPAGAGNEENEEAHVAMQAQSPLAAAGSAALTAPISVTARSTVTVTLVSSQPLHYGYEVVATYPHDPEAYTQGLQYIDGVLYEGTGLYGRSSLRRVDLESGAVEQRIDLDRQYFGEGIYVLDDRIYQLTWQSGVAFLYDRTSFEPLDQFTYLTEGWGLTYDGETLLMSDGSATIFRRDPESFAEVGRFTVTERGEPVTMLNELEYINGALWANLWQTNDIVIIEPNSGIVTARLNLAGILPEEAAAGAEVLNGIAYDAEQDRIFVTGKFWPLLFEIKLVLR